MAVNPGDYAWKGRWIKVAFVCITLGICAVAVFRLEFHICIETEGYSEIGTASLYFGRDSQIEPGNHIQAIAQEDGTLVFHVPASRYHFVTDLRLDPIDFVQDVTISRIYYTVAGVEVFCIPGAAFVQDVPAYAGIGSLEASQGKGVVHVENRNPNIFWGGRYVDVYNQLHTACSCIRLFFAAVFLGMAVVLARLAKNGGLQELLPLYGKLLDVCYNEKNRRLFLFAAAIAFLAVRLSNLIRYEGYYFNDEFYFLAEANEGYTSNYMRAPYLSFLVRLFAGIWGSQYYAVKAIPAVCGSISFCCVMYLAWRTCRHPGSILLAGLLLSFHALFQFNDFYVRMYACQETVLSIQAVLLYHIASSRKKWVKALLALSGFLLAAVIYNRPYGDISARIPFVVYTVSLGWILFGANIWNWLCGSGKLKYAVFGLAGIVISAELFFITVKKGAVDIPFMKEIVYLMRSFRVEETAVVLRYFFQKELFYTVSLILAGIHLLRKNQKGKTSVFLTAAFPLAALCMLLYDSRILRAFIGYLAVSVIAVVWYWDELLAKRAYAPWVAAGCIVSVLLSPVDMGWMEYKEQLYLYNEVYFCDYGALMEDAQKEREEGKKIIALFGGEQVLGYFEFTPDIDLCTWDENQNRNYTNEELASRLGKTAAEKDGGYVLLMDKAGADRLHEAELYYPVLQNHPFKIYHRNAQFNSLYMVYL